MRLFDISVLMRDARIVPGRLHTVMGHESLVAFRPVFALALVQLADVVAQRSRPAPAHGALSTARYDAAGAYLDWLVALRMSLAQRRKQCRPL